MKSPFPGMDPYLERRWGDFHTRFVTYLSDVVNPALPGSLRARVEERVLVEADDEPTRRYRPDAHIFQEPRAWDDEGGGVATLAPPKAEAVAEPIVFTGTLEEGAVTQRSLVILDAASGGRVITAIEMLSPTNKSPGRGQTEYRRKQQAYLDAGVNLLELDLLLQGAPTTLASRFNLSPEHRTLYHASLKNFRLQARIELYPISLRDPLPRIALPLREGDAPIAIDLQGVFQTTYDRGYYAQDTRYEDELADLPQEERAWVKGRVDQWTAAATSLKQALT